MLKDAETSYGLVAIILHWLIALAVIGLFALGLWMLTLTYYDPWYNAGPDVHRSVGMLLLGALLLRIVWRIIYRRPKPEPGHRKWERNVSKITHAGLNWLTFFVIAAGYFISSSGGEPIRVFDWFTIPALFEGVERQEEIAGLFHKYLAWALIVLAFFHAAAALKHHAIDRDGTLVRILVPGRTKARLKESKPI